MAKRFFEGLDHAAAYAKFRPSPPPGIAKKIISFLKEQVKEPFSHAVDVGCGPGQSTRILAPYFHQVTGFDVSESQIKEAITKSTESNIAYRVSPAEIIQLPDSSVELVTACQSIHWFNLEKFYSEVKRILTRGGVLATYGYLLPIPTSKDGNNRIRQILDKLYAIDFKEWWTKERHVVDTCYESLYFPFDDHKRERHFMLHYQSTVTDYLGYLTSWSAYDKMYKVQPDKAENLLKDFQSKLMDALHATGAPEETSFTVEVEYFLLMGRKPITE